MKTRATYKRYKKHNNKKHKSRKLYRQKKYKRGGQPLNYSVPNNNATKSVLYPEDQTESYSTPSSMMSSTTKEQTDFAEDAGKKVTDTVNQLKDVFNQATQSLKETLTKAKNKTLEQLSKVAQNAQNVAQTASDKIKEAQASTPLLQQTNMSGGKTKRYYSRSNKSKKYKKFPRHKNLHFYV